MTLSSSPETIISLQHKLDKLRKEHNTLERQIASLQTDNKSNDLIIHRLKREKLSLRDQMVRLEALLTPNIIA